MNLSCTISIYGGGPGSGCKGPNCGRKRQDDSKGHDIDEVLKHHDFIEDHPFRKTADERLARFQNIQIRSLAARVENLAKTHNLLDDFTKNSLKASAEALDEAEALMAKGEFGPATGKQDAALNTLHFLLGSFR